MKTWYAIQETTEDDWGKGSFAWDEAVQMAKKCGYTIIAAVDAGYDENGNATKDAFCINEYLAGEDF